MTATRTPGLLGAACASPTPLDGDGAFPVVSAGNGVGAVMWLNNSFKNLVFSFFNGSTFGTPKTVSSSSDALFLIAVRGNPKSNQYYSLFTDNTAGTLSVLEVNSDGTTGTNAAIGGRALAAPQAAASPVSLGSFGRGVIAVDPTTDTVYVGAQNGLSQPQLLVSTNNGASFQAGPTLPTLPTDSLLNGIAANSGTLAVLYNPGGAEDAIILPSGGNSFGPPITMFTETNGSFQVNGVAMNAAGTLAIGVLDTPGGSSTSLYQSVLTSGSSTPLTTTLASGLSSPFPQPGGGIQSNGDTAFGYVDPGELEVAQTSGGTVAPPIDTGQNAPKAAGFDADDGFGIAAFVLGNLTPGPLSACPFFPF